MANITSVGKLTYFLIWEYVLYSAAYVTTGRLFESSILHCQIKVRFISLGIGVGEAKESETRHLELSVCRGRSLFVACLGVGIPLDYQKKCRLKRLQLILVFVLPTLGTKYLI